MKHAIVCLLVILSTGLAAQKKCGTDSLMERWANAGPANARSLASFDSLMARFEAGFVHDLQTAREKKRFVIPVVVHILYRTDAQNISDAQVHSQIEVLNRDFNWQQTDKDQIPEVWRDLGEPAEIYFQLADTDPDGNHTNGITRTKVYVEDIGSTERYYQSDQGGVDPWPQPHYLNIWVCEIEGNNIGFSYLPAAKMAEADGVVIEHIAFGTTGTASHPHDGGRTLVHEVGHYLGLRHTWGSDDESCSSTDYMSDTPWQKGPNYGCKEFPVKSCPGEPNGDMFMNFMDYSNDACALLFTRRQVEFMRLVLLTNRLALHQSPGITGIDKPVQQSLIGWRWQPHQNHLVVSNKLPQPVDLRLIDPSGRWVLAQRINPGEEVISLDDLSAGFYGLIFGELAGRIVILK
ncbi:MAG: hypothetical protein Kow0075_00950 [Salibacteraceae bacterium]